MIRCAKSWHTPPPARENLGQRRGDRGGRGVETKLPMDARRELEHGVEDRTSGGEARCGIRAEDWFDRYEGGGKDELAGVENRFRKVRAAEISDAFPSWRLRYILKAEAERSTAAHWRPSKGVPTSSVERSRRKYFTSRMREVLSARSLIRPSLAKCQASPCAIAASLTPVKRWLACFTASKKPCGFSRSPGDSAADLTMRKNRLSWSHIG
jgi:hypothetical protein